MKAIITFYNISVFLLLYSISGIYAQSITINTPPSSPFCGGDLVPVTFSITGTFNAGNIFFIEMSDGSGDFSSPTTIGNVISTTAATAITTIPVVTPGTDYRFRVRSTDPVVISSNVTSAISISSPGGVEGTYGNGSWYVSVYKDNAFASYGGFFETGSALDFNTTTYFDVSDSPASFAGFDGCLIPDDNFSMSFRRRNFPCAYYQVDVPSCNDNCELIIDGTTVSSGWKGLLGPNSQVELRVREFTGDAEASLTFTVLPFALTTNSPVVKCSDPLLFSTLTVSAPVALDYTWTPSTFLSSTTGASVTSNANGGDITYTVTGTDAISGCSYTTTLDVIMAPVLAPLTVNVSPATPIICPSESVTLTANGASNYIWESWNPVTLTWETPTTLNTTTEAMVIASPTVTTEYRVTGDDGCGNDGSQTVTVVVGTPPSVDDTVFGDGVWRAYAYNGDLLAGSATLTGVYEQTGLGFNSNDAWNNNSSPDNALGYIGCLVNDDSHSVSYKREGFPCDFYQIDINRYNNDYELYIDGTLIYSNTGAGTDLDVWRGILHADSKVEYRWKDDTGTSEASITISPVDPIIPTSFTIPQDVITCPRTINLAVNSKNFNPLAVYATTYEWTENGSINIASGVDNISQVPSVTTTSYEVTITQTLSDASTCIITDNVTIIKDLIPDITVNPENITIPPNSSVTLTANSPTIGATYTWSPTIGLNTTTGATVIATPAINTTYTVIADDGCNTNTITVTINLDNLNQVITFEEINTKTVENVSFELVATASSGLPVTFTSSNPTVADISGTTVNILSIGITDITASQGGNTTYNPAPDVVQTLVVGINDPSNLRTDTLLQDGPLLMWQDNSLQELGFEIQRARESFEEDAFEVLDTVATNDTTYFDSSVLGRVDYTYRVRALAEGGFNSPYSNLLGVRVLNKPLGLDNLQNVGVKLYPNPVKETLQIELHEIAQVYIKVFNIQGKLIDEKLLNTSENWDMAGYPLGQYIFLFQIGEAWYQEKIMKE